MIDYVIIVHRLAIAGLVISTLGLAVSVHTNSQIKMWISAKVSCIISVAALVIHLHAFPMLLSYGLMLEECVCAGCLFVGGIFSYHLHSLQKFSTV